MADLMKENRKISFKPITSSSQSDVQIRAAY